jgi:putative membrane protein
MSEDRESRNNNSRSNSSSSMPYVQQHLANERTFLAWLRTCIALIGLGFVISKFDFFLNRFSNGSFSDSNTSFANVDYASLLGLAIIVIGIILIVYALKSYLCAYKSIDTGVYIPKRSIIYAATVSFVVLSILIIAYLLFLF